MKRDTLIAAGAAVGLVGLVLALSENTAEASTEPRRDEPPPLPPAPPEPPPPVGPPAPVPPARPALDTSDDEAMARMFQSETSSDEARIVIGWISLQVARRRGIALFDLFTSPQFQYGPRVIDGVGRYASTAKEATEQTKEFAKLVVSGQLVPSLAIRVEPISAWVEWLRPNESGGEARARELIAAQKNFGNLWRRIAGTNWYLYSRNGKPITATDGKAAATLRKLTTVSAVDRG